MTTVTAAQPALGELAQEQREHRPPVDRQHRLRVALGERPQPRADAGGDHHGVRVTRAERAERDETAQPCCGRPSSGGSPAAARGAPSARAAAAALVSGGPKRASASAAANAAPSAPSSSRTSCRSSAGVALARTVDPLVGKEVGKLASRRAGEPPRITGQVAQPAADQLREHRSHRRRRPASRSSSQNPAGRPSSAAAPPRAAVLRAVPSAASARARRAAARVGAARPAEGVRRVAGVESDEEAL